MPAYKEVRGALGATLEALERVVAAVLPSARPRESFVQVLAAMTLR